MLYHMEIWDKKFKFLEKLDILFYEFVGGMLCVWVGWMVLSIIWTDSAIFFYICHGLTGYTRVSYLLRAPPVTSSIFPISDVFFFVCERSFSL